MDESSLESLLERTSLINDDWGIVVRVVQYLAFICGVIGETTNISNKLTYLEVEQEDCELAVAVLVYSELFATINMHICDQFVYAVAATYILLSCVVAPIGGGGVPRQNYPTPITGQRRPPW
jgi:hypothetical protein